MIARFCKVFDVRVKNFTVSRAVASIICAVLGGVCGAGVVKLLFPDTGLDLLAYVAGTFLGMRAHAWWLNRSDARQTSAEQEE